MPSQPSAVSVVSPWRELGSLRVRTARYAPGLRQPRHRHREAGLSLILAGALEEDGPDRPHRAAAGALVFKPAECWHADHYGPNGAVMLQVAPRDDDDEPWRAIRWNYLWSEAAQFARAILAIAGGRPRSEENAELAFWEAMEGAIPKTDDVAPRWWPRAVELLNASLEERISTAEIARTLGVHPVHLARVCRRQVGCSLRQYLLERRTVLAWRRCTAGEHSLAQVAADLGFADQAHMTRTFANKLGVPPTQLRRLAAGLN